MKIQLFGKNSTDITKLVVDLGFSQVNTNPDVIISYGGDGTLLSAERQYPGIPKLPVRNSKVCKKCPIHEEKLLLKKLLENKLELKKYKKLQTEVDGQKITALNDFVIRNQQPHAIRFAVSGGPLLIGDGIVISTPFGSSGYFKSISRKTFSNGFGVAFNNITEEMDPIYLEEKDTASFELKRGMAILTFDNSPDIYRIPENVTLEFKLSPEVAKIYEAESLRCPNCKVVRG